jgi:flagella synthesis protein FlgN
VRACQQVTTRNSALLADQFTVMQRVLHGEEQVYAPR